jgi:hypothetical protein
MAIRQRDAMQSLEFILFEGLTNYEYEMGFRNFETCVIKDFENY